MLSTIFDIICIAILICTPLFVVGFIADPQYRCSTQAVGILAAILNIIFSLCELYSYRLNTSFTVVYIGTHILFNILKYINEREASIDNK